MFQLLEQYIRQRIGTNDQYLEEVLLRFTRVPAKRNQILLHIGDTCRYCYFVNSGCIQIFYVDRNANEATRDFVFEGNFLTELHSFVHQQPSKECFRAIEKSELLAISRQHFFSLVDTVPQFAGIYRENLETAYTQSVNRISSFMAMDALERVQWMMKNQPALLTRLSSKAVASYLNISPETLSRLKARL